MAEIAIVFVLAILLLVVALILSDRAGRAEQRQCDAWRIAVDNFFMGMLLAHDPARLKTLPCEVITYKEYGGIVGKWEFIGVCQYEPGVARLPSEIGMIPRRGLWTRIVLAEDVGDGG